MPPLPNYEEYQSRRYFSSLDIFRCWSILAVLWHHTQEGTSWFPADLRGFLGVDFFFVISGFLIVTLLLRERDRRGDIPLRRFYMRRTLRIFPIYYGMLAVLAAFFFFVKPNSRIAAPFFAELPAQVFYLSNFAKNTTILFFTWTLATEEQFYIFWPPIEKWLRNAAVPVLLAFIALNQCFNFRLFEGIGGFHVGDQFIFQITFTPICLGVLLAHMLHDRRWFDRFSSVLGPRWMSLVLLGVLILACNWPSESLMGWPRLVIQLSMTLLLASCVIREDHWVNRLFGARVVRRIGVVSYGMYLYHMFVVHAARALLGKAAGVPFLLFVTSFALTDLVAELSFRFYETPFLRLKDRLELRAKAASSPDAKTVEDATSKSLDMEKV